MHVETKLQNAYRHASRTLAFVDESFNLERGRAFYILAAAVVESADLDETRHALLAFYGGMTLHASPMFAGGEIQSLRKAIDVVAVQHDGLDVVVQRQMAPDDKNGLRARASCLATLIEKIYKDFECRLFVLDSNSGQARNEADLQGAANLRHAGRISRDTNVIHTSPRLEPLLGMPDVVAWAYRQEFTGRSTKWFEPLREQAQVSFVS